jgi:hypothetical protein
MEDNLLTADGFDDAILGVVEQAGGFRAVCYDSDKCIEILMETGNIDRSEAEDYFYYNTTSAFVGKTTPVFLNRMTKDEIDEMEDENNEVE